MDGPHADSPPQPARCPDSPDDVHMRGDSQARTDSPGAGRRPTDRGPRMMPEWCAARGGAPGSFSATCPAGTRTSRRTPPTFTGQARPRRPS